MEFSQAQIRAHASKIILEHARDVEHLSISEMLEDLELSIEEHDKLCDLVDEAIKNAIIVIGWDLDMMRESLSQMTLIKDTK